MHWEHSSTPKLRHSAICVPGSETMPHFVLFMVTHTDSPSRTIGCIRQRAAAANLRSSSTGKVFSFIAIPCK
jgi:hypothetical protein